MNMMEEHSYYGVAYTDETNHRIRRRFIFAEGKYGEARAAARSFVEELENSTSIRDIKAYRIGKKAVTL